MMRRLEGLEIRQSRTVDDLAGVWLTDINGRWIPPFRIRTRHCRMHRSFPPPLPEHCVRLKTKQVVSSALEPGKMPFVYDRE